MALQKKEKGIEMPAARNRAATRFWFHLVRSARLIEARANQRMRKGYGQSMARFDVLAQLVHFAEESGLDWVPTGQLAGKLIATSSNATGLLDRMVSEDLITRRASPVDRRSFEIAITGSGRAVLEEMDQNLLQWIGEMLTEIPVEDLAEMTQHLIKIRQKFLDEE
ncbi:MAG: MarR family transcriptional regulator [Fimbriimonadaceae bacterium]|nr:MarR family transcriptional regulator [Alphaproteobacteria bacterium]